MKLKSKKKGVWVGFTLILVMLFTGSALANPIQGLLTQKVTNPVSSTIEKSVAGYQLASSTATEKVNSAKSAIKVAKQQVEEKIKQEEEAKKKAEEAKLKKQETPALSKEKIATTSVTPKVANTQAKSATTTKTKTSTPATTTKTEPAPAKVNIAAKQAQAQSILSSYIARYPILKGCTIKVKVPSNPKWQGCTYYALGLIIINPNHTASLQTIIWHECEHIIDWREDQDIDHDDYWE